MEGGPDQSSSNLEIHGPNKHCSCTERRERGGGGEREIGRRGEGGRGERDGLYMKHKQMSTKHSPMLSRC